MASSGASYITPGPITFYQLVSRFGSAEAALEALPEIARRGGRQRPLAIAAKAAVERELAALAKAGAQLVGWGEPLYPPALAAIEDAPPLISVRGHTGLLTRRAVAIVGARNASANGRRFARDIALQLGGQQLVVVSGLARGIDAAAHEGALPTGTIAVLAGGIDTVYPEENRALHEAIAERGVLVAEMPVGTEPQARHFPRRNRIISGLRAGRAGGRGGDRLGLAHHRALRARSGARGLRRAGLAARSALPRHQRSHPQGRDGWSRAPTTSSRSWRRSSRCRSPSAGASFSPAHGRRVPDEAELETARDRVLGLLSPSPVPVDELVRQCHLSPAIVVTVLLELELAGRIERQPGNQVSLL